MRPRILRRDPIEATLDPFNASEAARLQVFTQRAARRLEMAAIAAVVLAAWLLFLLGGN